MNPLAALAQAGPRARTLAQRIAEADGADVAPLWLEAAEAFVVLGDHVQVHACLTEARAHLRRGQGWTLRGDVEWRLAQTSEVLGRLSDAMTHYEAAADIFRREDAIADEAIARLRLAEVTFRESGAGAALRAALDAVLAARQAGDRGVLVAALLLAGELLAEGGAYEDAIVRFNEALRLAGEAEGGFAEDEVRARIGLAECHLALDDSPRALEMAQAAGPGLELAATTTLQARAAGLVVMLMLDARVKGDELANAIAKARQAYVTALDPIGLARFLMRIGQRVERHEGAATALPWLNEAWTTAAPLRDERIRATPIIYALARCHAELEAWVFADLAIEEALLRVTEVNDLEGLEICTEIGVTIAVNLDLPALAVRRLVALARARALNGDDRGRIRTLIAAFEAALKSKDMDVRGIAEELMDALRESGPLHLGPSEFRELAEQMSLSGSSDFARELYEREASRAMAEGRPHETARFLVAAARECWRLKLSDEGTEIFKRAMQLGVSLGLREVDGIRIDLGPGHAEVAGESEA